MICWTAAIASNTSTGGTMGCNRPSLVRLSGLKNLQSSHELMKSVSSFFMFGHQ